jgi:CheY-like chemotaxis protein
VSAPPAHVPVILLVEDNPLNRKLATVILQNAGYQVDQAGDAVAAERSILRRRPDAILMDMGLPGKDGFTLTRELARDPITAQIPVLAVTSYAMKGDEQRAREAGCRGYLTKPINREELLRQCHGLLTGSPEKETA